VRRDRPWRCPFVAHRLPPGLSVRHRVARRLGRFFGWLWESSPEAAQMKTTLAV